MTVGSIPFGRVLQQMHSISFSFAFAMFFEEVSFVLRRREEQETRKRNRFTMECRRCRCIKYKCILLKKRTKQTKKTDTNSIFKVMCSAQCVVPSSNCFWEITHYEQTKWKHSIIGMLNNISFFYMCRCFVSFFVGNIFALYMKKQVK